MMSDSDPDQSPTWFDTHSAQNTPPPPDPSPLDYTWEDYRDDFDPIPEPSQARDVEVDEGVCRVCRCGQEDGPLIDPCLCKGTMRYVHESCLADWVNVTGKDRCELCKHSLEYDNGQSAPTLSPPHIRTLLHNSYR